MTNFDVDPQFLSWWLDIKMESIKLGEIDNAQSVPPHWRLNGLSVEEAIRDPQFQAENSELMARLMTYLVHTS
jgi:hypothetical protein